MRITIEGASGNNLKDVDVVFRDGLTVVTGASGSGKSTLVFDTLFREADRHFMELFAGSAVGRQAPAEARSIRGLGPTVAISQDLLNRNPNSTVATFSGLHPHLRLLFARFGDRHCAGCGQAQTDWAPEDLAIWLQGREVAIALLHNVVGSHRTLLAALIDQHGLDNLLIDGRVYRRRPTLAADSAHTIAVCAPSPNDLEMARRLIRDAGAQGATALIVDGTPQPLAPVCTGCGRWFNPLTPVHFKSPCGSCNGNGCSACNDTGLHAEAAATRFEGYTLPGFLGLSVDVARSRLSEAVRSRAAGRLFDALDERLSALQAAGLGYLCLARPAPSLSRGEGQRIRLAVSLVSALEGVVHVLDEPTVGLHAADVVALMPALRNLPGPVIYVEHDRIAAAAADHAIDMGPGAGTEGGHVVFEGTPAGLWQADTLTGRYFSQRTEVALPETRDAADRFVEVMGARANNLKNVSIRLALRRLNVVCGVSGSGKTSLIGEVLVPSLKAGEPVSCAALVGATDLKPLLVDQSPIGRNPRSNPATYTKLADVLRDVFAAATPLSTSHFSFNRPEGACPACEGMGAIEVKMRFVPSAWLPCRACDGQRFNAEVRAARISFGEQVCSIADVLNLTVAEARETLVGADNLTPAQQRSVSRILQALMDIGLGYLTLGQPSPTLSGGEAQRVKLARHLGSRSLADKVIVLDEPSTGLHPSDTAGLLTALDRLVRRGSTVVVIEHNLDLIRAADWIVELGPGSGPAGGTCVFEGPAAELGSAVGSPTAVALASEQSLIPGGGAAPDVSLPSIVIRGARANNLRDVSVTIPQGELTVVTGISGSGKSSLLRDVLETEARRRFLASLSMYERQGIREGAAQAAEVAGLPVTVPISDTRRLRNPRASVGSVTDVTHYLAVTMAALGQRKCETCDAGYQRRDQQWGCPTCDASEPLPVPENFLPHVYGSACNTCQGLGTLREPDVEKLIVQPEKPLCAGAMYSPGFFPQGYYGKPFNGGYDELQTIAGVYGFDPFETPWQDMSEQARQVFLFGEREEREFVYHTRKLAERRHTHRFRGVFEIFTAWDQGGTYTHARRCPDCDGERLRPAYRAIRLAGMRMPALTSQTLEQALANLRQVDAGGAPAMIADTLDKARRCLELMVELGLGYLHLNRPTSTLSAGEAGRVSLAKVIASGMTGLAVLMDEPSRGMHPREVARLGAVLRRLVDLGNTAVVVEHDPDIILAADYVVDMGPGAGADGGQVVGCGSPAELTGSDTATGRALGKYRAGVRPGGRVPTGWITITGARENTLAIDRVDLPLGVLAGVCGVSGSGKSTLIMDTLARHIAPRKHSTSVAQETVEPGEFESITGAPERCIEVTQARAGIASPARFLGLDAALQRQFAASEDAAALGLTEVVGQHCPVCAGAGIVRVDLGFLASDDSVCEGCSGTGLPPELDRLRLRGGTLGEFMLATAAEVLSAWADEPKVARTLVALQRVGLGYLRLHQPARSLSGGEIQRLKLAKELARKVKPETLYLLDEPTAGLHLEDVAQLLLALNELVDDGASVLLVEHHMEVLAACDYLVELGPGGGPDGGKVVAVGTPAEVALAGTPTSPWLAERLA